ncbi:uncharacterized protein LOC111277294 isoform X1 [Durio zibethinus]|uniref:Uncharacterized protein LOC111277294 isoform X1 n=1 Tax=Durio zibethinus TaxID=66656 RepID=A0A6P5WV49_DURZI|nr:uncharacterized protein LOC111277294 isoform X1 [Durio zibethinus]
MAAPSSSCFNCCYCSASKHNSSISYTNFPLSFSCPIFNGCNGISLSRTGFTSRTYAKFEKIQGDPSEANLEDTSVSSGQTQQQTLQEKDDTFTAYHLTWRVQSGNQVKQVPCLFLQEE